MGGIYPEEQKIVSKFVQPGRAAETGTAKAPPPPLKVIGKIGAPVVDGEGSGSGSASKRVKKVKKEYDLTAATYVNEVGATVKATDDKNLLITGTPIGYIIGEFKGLKKSQFARTCWFKIYRSEVIKHRGNRLIAAAGRMYDEAILLSKAKDDTQAKQVSKVTKVQNSLAKLLEDLASGDPSFNQAEFMAGLMAKATARAASAPAK